MQKNSVLKNIVFLDRMYVPLIVNVLYILSIIASIAGGIFLCFYELPDISISYNMDFSIEMKRYIAEGIALIILGPVAARLSAELLIILFKINEQAGKLADMSMSNNQQSDK